MTAVVEDDVGGAAAAGQSVDCTSEAAGNCGG